MNSENAMSETGVRLSAVSLILSGIGFVLFPVVRPFFDESSLAGASSFASSQWVLAHSFGMAGFIFLALGLQGLYRRLRDASHERLAFASLTAGWIGAGLTLPFFGAEAFSLQVIGRAAAQQGSQSLLSMVNEVRLGPGLFFIGVGLTLVAVATVLLAVAAWRTRALPRWAATLLALGFVVYIPQLQGGPGFQLIRVLVSLVILAGCIGLAVSLLRSSRA